eukprot:gene24334-56196_t
MGDAFGGALPGLSESCAAAAVRRREDDVTRREEELR